MSVNTGIVAANAIRKAANIAVIKKLFRKGMASVQDVADATGLTNGNASKYLRCMKASGTAHVAQDAVHTFQGSQPALWAAGSAPVVVADPNAIEEEIDYMPPIKPVKYWKHGAATRYAMGRRISA